MPEEVRKKLEEKRIFAASKNENGLTEKERHINKARKKFNSFDSEKWEKTYFDEETGGFVVTEKDRISLSKKSDNEFLKYIKEKGMNVTLANNGYIIEHTNESYDIRINDIKADLKKTAGSGNIEKYAKKAIREQGAEKVVFEFENNLKEIHTKLLKLNRDYGIHGYYYFSSNLDKVHEF